MSSGQQPHGGRNAQNNRNNTQSYNNNNSNNSRSPTPRGGDGNPRQQNGPASNSSNSVVWKKEVQQPNSNFGAGPNQRRSNNYQNQQGQSTYSYNVNPKRQQGVQQHQYSQEKSPNSQRFQNNANRSTYSGNYSSSRNSNNYNNNNYNGNNNNNNRGGNNYSRYGNFNNRKQQFNSVAEEDKEDEQSNSGSNDNQGNNNDSNSDGNGQNRNAKLDKPRRILSNRKNNMSSNKEASKNSNSDNQDDDNNDQNSEDQNNYDDDDEDEDDYDSRGSGDSGDDYDDEEDQDDQEDENDQEEDYFSGTHEISYDSQEEEQADSSNSKERHVKGKNANKYDIQIDQEDAKAVEELRILDQMCNETINEEQFNENIERRKMNIAFFERNKSKKYVKQKAMKVFARSAAGNYLKLENILSPIGILKSTIRLTDEILDYMLDKKYKPKEIVDPITDRLRSLAQEFEPISNKIPTLQYRKLMIEPKERLLSIYIAGINYFRKDSCLDLAQEQNGYSEKKHIDSLEKLSDSIIEDYKVNLNRVKLLILQGRDEDPETLKSSILANGSVYLSPMMPKIIAWHMLIWFNNPMCLHRMDEFLLLTLDSLISHPTFCAIFELVMALSSKNYFDYFKIIDTDKRLDYITANAALIHLVDGRFWWLVQNKTLVYPKSLEKVGFDLISEEGIASANRFLEKQQVSLRELKEKKEVKIEQWSFDILKPEAGFWPNFYPKIEWRRPSTFKAMFDDVFNSSENSDFVDLLLDNLIRADRKQPPITREITFAPSAVARQSKDGNKQDIQQENKGTAQNAKGIVGEKQAIAAKPMLNTARIEENKAAKAAAEAEAAEKQRLLRIQQRQEQLVEKWQKMIHISKERAEKRTRQTFISAISEQHVQDIYESYTQLKHFKKWKELVRVMKIEREKLRVVAKYKNDDEIRYGFNNEPVKLNKQYAFFKVKEPSSSVSQMEIEEQKQIDSRGQVDDILRVIDRSNFTKSRRSIPDSQEPGKSSDVFERIARAFLRLNETDRMNRTYFKVTVIADESNPLILKFVRSLSSYLSHGKMQSQESTFQITLVVDDVNIEYTLQLQMSKFLNTISPRDLSGSDLFMYIFTESDDRMNATNFSIFKQHLDSLRSDKLCSGFNMLFVSVGEKTIHLNGSQSTSKPEQQATPSIAGSKGFANTLEVPSHLSRQQSQSQSHSLPQLANQNSYSHLGTSSNSIMNQMITNFGYTNPSTQDSEGCVRQAIRYINSKLLQKRDMEQPGALFSYYNVISYTYEHFEGQKRSEIANPFTELIFKMSIDGAIEKCIRVKQQIGVIRISSLTSELQRLRGLFANQNENEIKLFASMRSSRFGGAGSANGNRNEFESIRMFLKGEGVIDKKKYADMKNFFVLKNLFNDCLFALMENFCSVIESTHLIPFDQLSNSDADTVSLIETSMAVIRVHLDKLFLKSPVKTIKASILAAFYSQYSYKNVTNIFEKYLARILNVNTVDKSSGSSDSVNENALHEILDDITSVIHENFSFTEPTEVGVIGNWQIVFVKVIDALIEIFTENDIPLTLTTHFKYTFDQKKIMKIAQEELDQMSQWLESLKKQDVFASINQKQMKQQKKKQPSKQEKNQNLMLQQLKRKNKHNSQYDQVVKLYKDIQGFNETDMIQVEGETEKEKQQGEEAKSETKSNSLEITNKSSKNKMIIEDQGVLNENKLVEEKSKKVKGDNKCIVLHSEGSESPISSSIDKSSDDEVEEIGATSPVKANDKGQKSKGGVVSQQHQNRKRRSGCLVLNSKDDGDSVAEYQEKIKKLMKGNITGSPTKFDDTFV